MNLFSRALIVPCLAVILAGQARADGCEAAFEASAEAMARERLRMEERDGFTSQEAASEAWQGCLSGLEAWGVPAGPELFPVPALAEVTERLCREARSRVLGHVPAVLPPAAWPAGERRLESRANFGQEVRNALR